MNSRLWPAVALAGGLLLLPKSGATLVAADTPADATLLRVFLRDGTSLVSFGEPARLGDRVVFSMPTANTPNPPLHLMNIPVDRVDWDRTDRYASAARQAHYLNTRAELDYTELSNNLAKTLSDVAAMADTAQRLATVERARAVLSAWPHEHYNYRAAEVRQMVGMLDEAIADLRAAAGASRFDISLSAFASEPPPAPEPLMPPPSLQESIQMILNAARSVDNSTDRKSLLSSAVVAIDRESGSLSAEWAAKTRTDAMTALRTEQRIDASYKALTNSMMTVANHRARAGDVRGVERLLTRVRQRDEELGAQRPEAVAALMGAIEAKLDATRRLRLARDRWALRLPVLAEYGAAIRVPIALFIHIKPFLEDIKSMAGSPPASLRSLEDGAGRLTQLLGSIAPPEELRSAHALMASAAQLASSAVAVRREAIMAADMNRAWNASSAAAGALMLGTKARAEILSLLRPPQLPQLR